MNETIAQIEDAILAALDPLKSGAEGIFAKKIETYQGDLNQTSIDDLTAYLALSYPAIMVMYLGSRATEDEANLYHDIQTWGVIVAAQNLRGEKEARRGNGIDAGSYEMIEAVKKILTGNSLGLTVQPPSLKTIDSLIVGPGISIYSMTFDVDLDYQATPIEGP